MALAPIPQPTGFSGFWQYHAPAGQAGQYNMRFARSSNEYQAAIALGKNGYRKWRMVARTLNGNAPGGTATDSYRRVTASQAMNDAQFLGGQRATQVVNNNTVTTTVHRDAINALIYDRIAKPYTYPRDLSGNGGGGKVGR